ncbi:NACHT domain-containing protein [Coleofasciculus sp. FACHB-542]|uniref:NACHT domain-containing protein n=1 Tax=Coleofasciculus sp. FACHB-542 TaxID=2692787 RepID=UPI0016892C2E|nr:NACHT domain-containing protein [Coleofasciculus sp. FACHB-542]MBD2084149.1 hypothetical protein [Coleofasciculus sp. FACHB-542]
MPRTEAIKLTDYSSIGTPWAELQPCDDKPLIVLIGEFGAGKSLLAERLFQRLIKQAEESSNAPVPVYLKAKKLTSSLQEAVEAEIRKLPGASIAQGVAVIIDGADELGSDLAVQLCDEACVLVNAWLKTTVVITSRPIPTLVESEEAVQVPLLSDEEAYALVERFSGQQITAYVALRWSQSVHDAIHRPLFAVLLGIYLRDRDMIAPSSVGELLSNLVERSLQQARASNPNVEQLLQHLAALSTDRSKGLVTKTEVASRSELQILLDSGLVVEDAGTISFSLPILTQWFAAQSLAAGIPDPNDLTNDSERLERWRYPIAIFVGSFDHDRVSKLLVPLAEKHPAFAAEIVNEELARRIWNGIQNVSLPSSSECGQRIQTAMQAWVRGIDPLFKLISPVRDDGTLPPIGIHIDEERLTTSWYCGSDDLADVVKLQFSQFGASSGWPTIRGGKPSPKSAWAWEWTLNELVYSLSKLLQNRELPINDGLLLREAVWQTALTVTRRGKFNYTPISLIEIEECLAKLPLNIFPSGVTNRRRTLYLNQLMAEINHLREAGKVELRSPLPEPDLGLRDGWIGKSYTQQQLLARAKAVYSGAIEGYKQLVDTWFPKLAPQLKTAVMLPVRFVGVIVQQGDFGIHWHFEVLPHGSQSIVELSVGERDISIDYIHLRSALDEQLHSLRPEAATWIGYTMSWSNLDVFNPNSATELAYSWLWHDLERVSWVDGLLGRILW